MAENFDSNFSFNQQLWYYYTTNRHLRRRHGRLDREPGLVHHLARQRGDPLLIMTAKKIRMLFYESLNSKL